MKTLTEYDKLFYYFFYYRKLDVLYYWLWWEAALIKIWIELAFALNKQQRKKNQRNIYQHLFENCEIVGDDDDIPRLIDYLRVAVWLWCDQSNSTLLYF